MGGARSSGFKTHGPASRIHIAAKSRTLATQPLPWPPPDAPREGRRPHAHRCFDCGRAFRCPGPDETGACAPVCGPCYWVELGRQLKTYRAVMAALNRKRRQIEKNIGADACAQAQAERRKSAADGAIIAGLGGVMVGQRGRRLLKPAPAHQQKGRVRTRSDRIELAQRSSRKGALAGGKNENWVVPE